MPRGKPNKEYTGEFKQFEIPNHERVRQWERIYLEEGSAGLYVERRGHGGKGRPPSWTSR